ncbi:unnamed protein product [Merluccius merluccius]
MLRLGPLGTASGEGSGSLHPLILGSWSLQTPACQDAATNRCCGANYDSVNAAACNPASVQTVVMNWRPVQDGGGGGGGGGGGSPHPDNVQTKTPGEGLNPDPPTEKK